MHWFKDRVLVHRFRDSESRSSHDVVYKNRDSVLEEPDYASIYIVVLRVLQ